MIKILKRPLSILLAVLMIASIFASVPMTAHAYQYYEEFTKNTHDVINLEDYVNITNNKDGTITVQMPHFGDKSSWMYGLTQPSAVSTTWYKCHYAYKFKEQSDYLDEVSTGYREWERHKVQDHTPFGSQDYTIDITNGKPYTGLYVVCHQHNDYHQNDPEAYETAADPCPAPGQEYIKGVYDYRNPVKITYNLNGGNVGGSTDNKTEYLFSGNALATTFSTPQRTGYSFKGWYTAASGGTKVTSSNATEATTYYAQWEVIPSVTLNGGNNATRSGGSVYQEPSGAMTKVTYTANSGYYFKQSDFPVSSNGITATWKSDTTVEVTGTPTTHVSLTVPDAKPRASVTTAPTANELTETGSYQNLVSAGSASGGTMYYAVTTENTMPDASSYSTTIPTGRGGTYYVWYKTVGDENHIDTTPASVTVTLNEGEVTKPTSFKQATSLGDITEDNIETCTFAQAKSWIVANWDNVVAGAGIEYVKVAYYNSDTDKLNVWSLNGWESKDKFLNNSYDYFREQGSIGDLQQCYGDDEYVYLCGAAAPAPSGPEEPTSDLFTKISSADEITDERIRTCTKEEAKAWILENWDDVVDPTKCVDFAYYDSDTGNLNIWSLDQCGSKNAFLNNSDYYFKEDYTINALQIWYDRFGDTVYLCTGVVSAPEPAYTVSFEKETSADQITEDKIDTCTKEEAKAWILANWDSIELSYWGSTYFAYYSGDSLCAFRLSYSTSKSDFETNYDSLQYSVNDMNLSNVNTWDDIVYLCKTATAVAEPAVNNVYRDGFIRLSDLSVGDVVVKDVSSIQTNNCTVVLYGGRYGQGNPVNVCTSSLTLGNPSIANSPDLQFEDFSNYKSYYPVDASGNIANAFIVMAKDGNTLTLAGINVYTITWEDGNNNALATEVYGGGATPSYKGATPTKASTALYTYTFAGWSDGTTTYGLSDTLPAVSGDVTYTAQFNQTTRKYRIIWKSDANTIIGISKVAYEITPYHAALAGYEDAQYIYTFAGWSDGTNTYPVNKLPLVTANATYTAVYNATEKTSYTVIWKNGDTTLETDTDVVEGTTPTYNGATPTKASTAQYTYTFAGWSPEVAAVTGNVTYTAQFNQTTRNYTITWKSDANTLIDTTQVAYGATPTHAAAAGYEDAENTYTFSGWTPEVTAVTGEATYTATFEATPKKPNNGTNITVADTISENFYIDEEYYRTTYGNDVHVTLNYNHASNISETPNFQTETMALSSLPALNDSTSAYDGARMLSVIQAPAQSTENITIKVYASEADAQAGKNPVDTIEYCVYDYCRAILTGEYSDGWKELAETTLDYCAAAQTYFGYNTDNMATKDNGGEYYNSLDSADFSKVANIVKPACIKKASMVAKSDLEINLLSLTPITVTGASMDADDSKERFSVSNSVNGDYYEVNIKGIVPANMNKTITINTDEGDIVLTANAIMKIMANSSNANLANMAKAMYLYGAAAYKCFD